MSIITKPVPIWLLLAFFSISHSTEPVCSAALPNIADQLGIEANKAQLLSSIYFLGFATGILSLGRISDIWGRRNVALIGLVLYFISSIACSYTNEVNVLLILRFIQAFGISVGSVIAQAMARDSYKGNALSEVYLSIALCLSLIPSLGSTIGGYIVELSDWRYNFRFLAITSGTMIVVAYFYLPETNRYINLAKKQKYFDVFKDVISNKTILLYAIIVGSFNGMMFSFYVEAPFIFIKLYQFSPSDYGKLFLFLTFAYMLGALINKQLLKRNLKVETIIIAGMSLSLFSCSILFISILLLPENISKISIIFLIFIPIVLQLIGHNLVVPIILRLALENYSKVTGTAGSIFGSIYYLLVAIINFTVSRIHSDNILPFASLFLFLSLVSFISYQLIRKQKQNINHNYN